MALKSVVTFMRENREKRSREEITFVSMLILEKTLTRAKKKQNYIQMAKYCNNKIQKKKSPMEQMSMFFILENKCILIV